jgi:hypothetical protein
VDEQKCSLLVQAPADRYEGKQYKAFNKAQFPHMEPQFGENMDKEQFTDVYEDISPIIHYTLNFDEGSDISTTYMGTPEVKRTDIFHTEGEFDINHHSRCMGKLLDGTPVRVLMDSGGSKCFMSEAFYKRSRYLHSLPKLKPASKSLTVGNGQPVPILFTTPVTINVGGHLFEFHAMVSGLQDDADLIFGIKDMYETEGVLNTRDSTYKFINRSIPVFPTESHTILPGQRRFVKVDTPFFEEISGVAIVKLRDGPRNITLKLKITKNRGMLDLTNATSVPMKMDKDVSLGILDLRSLGYYKVKHGVLEKQLSKYYTFETLQKICEDYNTCVNLLNEEIDGEHTKYLSKTTTDPYPWLEPEDPRRHMTDDEILHKYIDLSKSDLTAGEKVELLNMICHYKQAFSLRDEVGKCPNITIDIDVLDKSPFFVRPFPISEADKPFMDWQMERLISLGILTKNSTSHTSPVMLITRKLTADRRAVSDLRVLNSRVRRKNTTTVLIRDIFNILGNSKCEMMSCVDIKDAFHSIPLSKDSKEYCGILPYFGSPHYRYEKLPMGLATSPALWMQYINFLLESIEDRASYIAIMDDLLIHSSKRNHLEKLEVMFQSLIEHGLKLSPRKCQLCLTELVYMGNVFKIKNRRVTISPMKDRISAMLLIPAPQTPKECKSFCGVVNYLSLFCPELQKLLHPIYQLTRKGVPFIWTDEHQETFDEIKKRLTKPPVLHLPIVGGRYILYTDTSRQFVGSALWQVQEGKPKLVGYSSKTLHQACLNYSVTELEMQGLLISIQLWQHFIHHVEFDAAVDHQAAVQILHSKNKPATNRIKRLLEHLSQHAFNLYYVKGKDLILSDFLSRVRVDPDDDPYDIVPISCNAIQEKYRPVQAIIRGECPTECPQVQAMTRGACKEAGIKPSSDAHGADKMINPNKKPEHQTYNPYQKVSKPQAPQKPQAPIPQAPVHPTPIPAQPPKPANTPPNVLDTPMMIRRPLGVIPQTAAQTAKRRILGRSIQQLQKKAKTDVTPKAIAPQRLPGHTPVRPPTPAVHTPLPQIVHTPLPKVPMTPSPRRIPMGTPQTPRMVPTPQRQFTPRTLIPTNQQVSPPPIGLR